jgi:hypothetical protein
MHFSGALHMNPPFFLSAFSRQWWEWSPAMLSDLADVMRVAEEIERGTIRALLWHVLVCPWIHW